MNKFFKYKGYIGGVNVSIEENVLFGKIECINDLVTYEAETIEGLKIAFENAVDDYLETCNELGKKPNKTMSGTFNIRIGEDLHTKSYKLAIENGITLNEFVKKAIEEKISNKIELHFHIKENEAKVSYGTFGKTMKSWKEAENNKVH